MISDLSDAEFDLAIERASKTLNKKQTNADRIRAMSDEELADFLDETEAQYILIDLSIEDNWLDWLKREVE